MNEIRQLRSYSAFKPGYSQYRSRWQSEAVRCHRGLALFLSVAARWGRSEVCLAGLHQLVESSRLSARLRRSLVPSEAQLWQVWKFEYFEFTGHRLSNRLSHLMLKSLRSSLNFLSISSSSSCVRWRTSPFSSVFARNKLCRSVGISCCFRKAWSSGWVMLSKLWPYKSDCKRERKD